MKAAKTKASIEKDARVKKEVTEATESYRDEVVAEVRRFKEKVQPMLRELIAVAVDAATDVLDPDGDGRGAGFDEISAAANWCLSREQQLYAALCDGEEEWPVGAFLQ